MEDEWKDVDFVPVENPGYLGALTEYIANHPFVNVFSRASLLSGEVELKSVEASALQQLREKMSPITSEWNCHFATRDAQQSSLRAHLDHPAAGHTYVLTDYQDS